MSDHTIVIIQVVKILFVQFFCVFLPSLLNLLLLLGPYHFCPLSAHLCMKCSLGISNFLEEISSLSHSVVCLYFFALITEEGFLISFAILWNFAFRWVYLSFSPLLFTSLLSQLFVRPPQTAILLFCISFPWGWS